MHKKAFTLIEITISLLILAIGLVGILTLFPVGFDASGRAANITEATFLAQGLIEDLKREGYAGQTVVAAITTTQSGGFTDYPNYEYDIFAYDITLASGGVLREIVVRVYWPSNGTTTPNGTAAGQRDVELSTYLAKYEL